MNWYTFPVLLVFFVYLLVVARRRGFFTADALFSYFQLLIVTGTFPLLDATQPADVVYGHILAYCFTAFCLTAVFLQLTSRQLKSRFPLIEGTARVIVSRPTTAAWLLIGFCVLITIAYYTAIGYSALLVGLQAQVSGGSADIASLRLNSYSGTAYFAPGYVNQFKNALLPCLVILVLTYFTTTKYRHRLVASVLVLFTVFGIIGTAQRGAFVLSIVVLVVYLYMYDGKRFPPRLGLIAVFAIAVSTASTFALGRSSVEVDAASGGLGKVQALLSELVSRVVDSNQTSGIAGFRYTYGLPTQYGLEWAQSLQSLLPGSLKFQGTSLDSYIFASLYGSTRGTSPPSLWGSIYYNWGAIGVIVAPIAFAVLLFRMSDRALSRLTYSTVELVGIAGTFACLSSWVAGGPNYLFNTGGVTFALLWFVGRRISDRHARSTGESPYAARPEVKSGRTAGTPLAGRSRW